MEIDKDILYGRKFPTDQHLKQEREEWQKLKEKWNIKTPTG